jgi:hypothetical protein
MMMVRVVLCVAVSLALAVAASAGPPGDPPIDGISTGSADGSVELGLDALYPYGSDVYSLLGETEDHQFYSSGGLVGSGSIQTDIALLTCPGEGTLPQYSDGSGTFDIQVGAYEPDGENCEVRTTDTYDWACEEGPCVGAADPPTINSEANAGYDLLAGTAYLRATPYTESIGLDNSHFVRARASAGLSDWVWVEGGGPTATITLSAVLDYEPDMSFPVNFTTLAYGDMVTNPDLSTAQANLVDGSKEIEAEVGLEIRYAYETIEVCVPPDGEGEWICHDELDFDVQSIERYHRRGFDIEWSDNGTPGSAEENDDYPYTESYEFGAAIAATQSVQATVPTNTWVLIGGYGSFDTQCVGPLVCDITSTNEITLSASTSAGTLYSLTGIAGITVPEPDALATGGVALLALVALARRSRS